MAKNQHRKENVREAMVVSDVVTNDGGWSQGPVSSLKLWKPRLGGEWTT
jgi:hypothetical protein